MNCDRIARWYAALEYASFGNALLRTRCRYLHHCHDAKRVLLLGEGDGRFLQRLLLINSIATFDYVDVSQRMLELARQRCGDDRVRYHRLNPLVEELPSSSYDLVVTHFLLDCLRDEEVERLIANVAATSDEALWLVSEFALPGAGWRRLRAKVWVKSLYTAFRVLTGLSVRQLPDYAPSLAASNFECTHVQTVSAGLLRSELWQRLKTSRSVVATRRQVDVSR